MDKNRRYNFIDTTIFRDSVRKAEENLMRLKLDGQSTEDDIEIALDELTKQQILLKEFYSINAETRRESESRKKQNRL